MKTNRIIAVTLVALLSVTASLAAKSPMKMRQGNAQPGQVDAQWWGPRPGADALAQGPVSQVDASSITVQTRMRGAMQFAVNDQTKVRVSGKPAKITDIKQGDKVTVRFKPVQNGTPLALGIVVPDEKQHLNGEVESVQGGVVMVKTEQSSVSVTVTNQTKIMSHDYVGTIADLHVGYKVVVGGDPVAAKRIGFIPALAKGAVTEVNGNTITIKTIRQKVIHLQAGPNTAVLVRPRVGNNIKGSISDIKVGSAVNVGFHASSDGVSDLLWIDILTGI